MTFGSFFAGLSAEKVPRAGKAHRPVDPALQVEKSEAGGGLICWGREKYIWQQATDSFPAAKLRLLAAYREQCVSSYEPDYFGERMLAWVLMSRLCFSTTRRSSRSMVLNASWMTFLSGS